MTLTEAAQMMREVARVLRSGGSLLCVTRSDDDSRCLQATPVGRCTWRLDGLAPGAPSTMETGMEMLFFSQEEIQRLFALFRTVSMDWMIYIHETFRDDDWVESVSK